MSYGNQNIASYTERNGFLTFDGTSDAVALSSKAKAITLYATEDCYVNIGKGTRTAAAPSGEKVFIESFFLPADTYLSGIRVSGTDEAPWYVAAVQSTTGGNLYIYEHHDF